MNHGLSEMDMRFRTERDNMPTYTSFFKKGKANLINSECVSTGSPVKFPETSGQNPRLLKRNALSKSAIFTKRRLLFEQNRFVPQTEQDEEYLRKARMETGDHQSTS